METKTAYKILVINPGSTSTKIGVYKDNKELLSLEYSHEKKDLLAFNTVFEQFELRKKMMFLCLEQNNIDLNEIDCFVGRGGILPPIEGGVYEINDEMLRDIAVARFGEHACNLGAHLANDLSKQYGKPCFVVDPPSTDEVIPMAKITGLKDVKRRFIIHALSQRGIGRKASRDLGIDYEKARLVVAHLGGGISVGAHKFGRIEDAISAYDGEGPFSPERSGAIPALDILGLVEQGIDTAAIRKTITTESGLWDHLGTSDLREVESRMDSESDVKLLVEAMAYNIAKSITQMVPLLFDQENQGPIDGIVLTGGAVRFKYLADLIKMHVSWIAPVLEYPSTIEMEALAMGSRLALTGEIEVKKYKSPGIITP